MLDVLLNCLMLLGIIVAVALITIALICSVFFIVALIGKIIDVCRKDKPEKNF